MEALGIIASTQLAASGGGGGGVPEWVPANAKIYIDLVNVRAWTEADGIVAIDTLLGHDDNATNGWGATAYDGSLTADGYTEANSALAFLGAARTKLLTGTTTVCKYKHLDNAHAGLSVALLTSDGNDAVEVDLGIGNNDNARITLSTWSGSPVFQNGVENRGTGAVNIVAMTITPARLEAAANGLAVYTNTDVHPVVEAAIVDVGLHAHTALQSITIYDPLPSTAGLSELSRVIPDNAKIHINLVQDWAWTEDAGYVAINTLLGADANTVNGWGTSEYNAANLTADGYVQQDTNFSVAFISAARTKILDEATIVVRSKYITSDGVGLTPIALVSANGNDGVEINAQSGSGTSVATDSYGGSLTGTIPTIVNKGVGAINVFSATITATRLEFAVNASDFVANSLETDDRPVGNPFVAALVDLNAIASALQSITIYDPLPSTAGLSALSATGVTNTAPHDFVLGTFNEHFAGGICSATDVAGLTYPFALLVGNSVSDAEGNPVAWSITSDTSGKIALSDGVGPDLLWSSAPVEGDSVISCTLRATDPGGLYVEQEFTITVTA